MKKLSLSFIQTGFTSPIAGQVHNTNKYSIGYYIEKQLLLF